MAIFGLINNVSVAVYNLAGFIDEKPCAQVSRSFFRK